MMDYAGNTQMQAPGAGLGRLAQAQQVQRARTFDGISGALDRARQYNAQVQRILQRIAPTETLDKTAPGNCANETRPSYASAIEQLQDALGTLGRSLDELEGHI